MSGLKTYFLGFLAVCALPTSAALALSATLTDPLRAFATCTGRMSAQVEFQWMFDGDASEVTEMARASLIEILEAMIPEGQGRTVLSWRVEAKMAQAALLTRSIFNDNDRDAEIAGRIAKQRVRECRSLLLS